MVCHVLAGCGIVLGNVTCVLSVLHTECTA